MGYVIVVVIKVEGSLICSFRGFSVKPSVTHFSIEFLGVNFSFSLTNISVKHRKLLESGIQWKNMLKVSSKSRKQCGGLVRGGLAS